MLLLLNKEIKPAGCQEPSRALQRFCSALGAPGAEGARARPGGCEATELLCQRRLGPDGSCVCPQHFPLPTAAVCSLLATTSGAKGVQNHLELPSTAQASAQGKKGERVKEERLSDPTKIPLAPAAFSPNGYFYSEQSIYLLKLLFVLFTGS